MTKSMILFHAILDFALNMTICFAVHDIFLFYFES